MEFEITSCGSYRDCIWAVRVQPVQSSPKVPAVDGNFTILLAKQIGVPESCIDSIDNWVDITPDDARYFKFFATVGEQLRLQISVTRIGSSGVSVKGRSLGTRPQLTC
ncbi:hypothetical protein DRE_06321 [Drechslerella stenobrocha 248]|uniref:Uncharacterized protein n=1 Tax=Drechslerella stenobrocha 248 TaxID=1043628 RepID=W7HM25_9PEZI|nr:hypothetical protein DRE_06321 [Drechslerella stenobrocha 248]